MLSNMLPLARMRRHVTATATTYEACLSEWQVAISRSEHDAGSCPFCNKANYSVTYRAKTAAQRAAERKERENVEQAVARARQVGVI
jgi:hypothetical protein